MNKYKMALHYCPALTVIIKWHYITVTAIVNVLSMPMALYYTVIVASRCHRRMALHYSHNHSRRLCHCHVVWVEHFYKNYVILIFIVIFSPLLCGRASYK